MLDEKSNESFVVANPERIRNESTGNDTSLISKNPNISSDANVGLKGSEVSKENILSSVEEKSVINNEITLLDEKSNESFVAANPERIRNESTGNDTSLRSENPNISANVKQSLNVLSKTAEDQKQKRSKLPNELVTNTHNSEILNSHVICANGNKGKISMNKKYIEGINVKKPCLKEKTFTTPQKNQMSMKNIVSRKSQQVVINLSSLENEDYFVVDEGVSKNVLDPIAAPTKGCRTGNFSEKLSNERYMEGVSPTKPELKEEVIQKVSSNERSNENIVSDKTLRLTSATSSVEHRKDNEMDNALQHNMSNPKTNRVMLGRKFVNVRDKVAFEKYKEVLHPPEPKKKDIQNDFIK